MTYRIKENKWILYRHTRSFEMITAIAVHLKSYTKSSISNDEKLRLLLRLKDMDLYKERNPELPLDSINHRINTLAYFMFGYKDNSAGKKRLLYSPLGNLFLKHVGNSFAVSNIFLTMLWSIQFQHPHGGTDKSFHLYPFRLIFKLLSDKRLNYKLYAFEMAALVVFVKKVDSSVYEQLIKDILNLRALDNSAITELFAANRHVLVNATYEWDYYMSSLLCEAGVLNKHDGKTICKLQHGNSTKYITKRNVTKNYVTVNENVAPLVNMLIDSYPFTETPLHLDDPEMLNIDVIKRIYSFFPGELLSIIGESDKPLERSLLDLPRHIEEYAENEDEDSATNFEKILEAGFNMFYNVIAKHVGGSGKTDIECIYTTEDKKFAVDAKSTKHKLQSLSAGRLRLHREGIGGVYTIVITPRFVPGVLEDIKHNPIVIIRASTFSEYLYNCIINDYREIDYSGFDTIIENNLGKDVSSYISELTLEQFAVEGTT